MGIINIITITTNRKKIDSMASVRAPKTFSDEKHAQGRWNTRLLDIRNPVARWCASYLSFKRRGVDKLAQTAQDARFVLDAGCGKGAYGHWFLGRSPKPCIIAVDWSYRALRDLPPVSRGRILRVCADLQKLPFKSGSMHALFSVDTLGHVPSVPAALDEFLRVCIRNSPLFIHGECSDYRTRWPDRALLVRLGKDLLAEYDGHCSLYRADELYSLYSQRFLVRSFFSPAGYMGWLLGYPEKYWMAFTQAHMRIPALSTVLMAALKKVGLIRVCLLLFNAFSNHAEKFFGLHGGGSCFAEMRRP